VLLNFLVAIHGSSDRFKEQTDADITDFGLSESKIGTNRGILVGQLLKDHFPK
jgi:hypothetical protein